MTHFLTVQGVNCLNCAGRAAHDLSPAESVLQEFPKQGIDLQSEAMVMARKKLKDSDANDMAYRTKMT